LNPRPLGYEPYDIGLCRLKPSLAGAVTSADRTNPVSLRRLRLPRLKLSRRVRFTNRFTEGRGQARPAPSGMYMYQAPSRSAVVLRAKTGLTATCKASGSGHRRDGPSGNVARQCWVYRAGLARPVLRLMRARFAVAVVSRMWRGQPPVNCYRISSSGRRCPAGSHFPERGLSRHVAARSGNARITAAVRLGTCSLA